MNAFLLTSHTVQAQTDSLRRDSTTVQNGIYNRPFIGGIGRTSIGGYAEANTNYIVENGATGGFSMEMRRFNIFLYSAIGPRLRFTSELEFEHGTDEISLETALLDFQFDPAFVLRAGILLVPIGGFNQSHDSPRWEFIDRPLVSTRIIPATLSDIGFGANGRIALRRATLTYDAYVTNGLGDGVILNGQGRTSLAAGKRASQFEEDNNGSPALSARVAVQRSSVGEIGVSYYRGIYNSFRRDGVVVDEHRSVSIAAIDLSTAIGQVALRGEVATTHVDIPVSLRDLFAERQWGMHVDAVIPIWRPRLPGLRNATVNAALRVEYIDQNVGTFSSTGRSIGDDVLAFVPGISFRPAAGTVFKVNYRRQWSRDLLGNPAIRLGGFQVGVATYF